MSVVFNHLSPSPILNHADDCDEVIALWQAFYQNPIYQQEIQQLTHHLTWQDWQLHQQTWHQLHQHTPSEQALTDWLIAFFNQIFSHTTYHSPTCLVRGNNEPEYFASQNGKPARIEFAHGFFASSLHEISHWCIAGKQRRLLDDFGYWYCPDGRDQITQKQFEQVEIKPQAIECLLSLALNRYFYVSQDNLNADFDTSDSTFAKDVFYQAKQFLYNPKSLPADARHLLWLFLHLCYYPNQPKEIL